MILKFGENHYTRDDTYVYVTGIYTTEITGREIW